MSFTFDTLGSQRATDFLGLASLGICTDPSQMNNVQHPALPYRPRNINPRTKLKPLALRLLAVSNALWQRPDSLRRVRGEI